MVEQRRRSKRVRSDPSVPAAEEALPSRDEGTEMATSSTRAKRPRQRTPSNSTAPPLQEASQAPADRLQRMHTPPAIEGDIHHLLPPEATAAAPATAAALAATTSTDAAPTATTSTTAASTQAASLAATALTAPFTGPRTTLPSSRPIPNPSENDALVQAVEEGGLTLLDSVGRLHGIPTGDRNHARFVSFHCSTFSTTHVISDGAATFTRHDVGSTRNRPFLTVAIMQRGDPLAASAAQTTAAAPSASNPLHASRQPVSNGADTTEAQPRHEPAAGPPPTVNPAARARSLHTELQRFWDRLHSEVADRTSEVWNEEDEEEGDVSGTDLPPEAPSPAPPAPAAAASAAPSTDRNELNVPSDFQGSTWTMYLIYLTGGQTLTVDFLNNTFRDLNHRMEILHQIAEGAGVDFNYEELLRLGDFLGAGKEIFTGLTQNEVNRMGTWEFLGQTSPNTFDMVYTPFGVQTRASTRKIPRAFPADADASVGCRICLGDYNKGDVCRSLPTCHHTFHQPCIDQWVLGMRGKNACPLCRVPIIERPA